MLKENFIRFDPDQRFLEGHIRIWVHFFRGSDPEQVYMNPDPQPWFQVGCSSINWVYAVIQIQIRRIRVLRLDPDPCFENRESETDY